MMGVCQAQDGGCYAARAMQNENVGVHAKAAPNTIELAAI